MSVTRLDSRAWLVWGIGCMVPLLISRNPVTILEILIIVLGVRGVWGGTFRTGWGWLLRIAPIMIGLGVLFNALTVRSGNQVAFRLPSEMPIIGGAVTWNAILYGVVSGLAVLTLVATGVTVAAAMRWTDLVRSMPGRLMPLAVAGSVAWGFLPGAAQGFSEIRDAQSARGHRLRGVRDVPPLVVPLLDGGLERAMTMAEALEARGFGGTPTRTAADWRPRVGVICLLGGALIAGYAVTAGSASVAIGAGLAVLIGLGLSLRYAPIEGSHTAWRKGSLTMADWSVIAASLVSLTVLVIDAMFGARTGVFNPYPNITWPTFSASSFLAAALLVVPALWIPLVEDVPDGYRRA